MRLLARAMLVVMLLAVVIPVLARGVRADEALWRRLAGPGHAILVRHADAPGFGDPPGFVLGDCATQRNLSEAGRAHARRIGVALRARGVRIDRVYSSLWCRCLETAELIGVGKVEPLPALNSLFKDPAGEARQTGEVKALLARLPAGENVLLSTHNFNVRALTGIGPAAGELVIVKRDGSGRHEPLGRLTVQ